MVLRPAAKASPEELMAYVRGRLAGYNTPRLVEFTDELPRNAVGKIQKHLLRDRYGSMFEQPARSSGGDSA